MSPRADTEISNSSDVIDSRDIIARIDYLEGELDDNAPECGDCDGLGSKVEVGDGSECESCNGTGRLYGSNNPDSADDHAELEALKALADEAEGYAPDWLYGETLIRDSYFETYAQELAEDIGAIKSDATWPNTCIDWKQATRELQQDYTSVDFDGVTYWVR